MTTFAVTTRSQHGETPPVWLAALRGQVNSVLLIPRSLRRRIRGFEPNGSELWQTVGDVWERCTDWLYPTCYQASPGHNPQGPKVGTARLLSGGSYVCHDSYCERSRNSARLPNTAESSMENARFRTVAAGPSPHHSGDPR